MKKIILASASLRRRELFKKFGLKFISVVSGVEEGELKGLTPSQTAEYFSKMKARRVADRHKTAVVVAADTIVACGGKILGKPVSRRNAEKMLEFLSGRQHSVITAFTVIEGEKEMTKSVRTKVFFRNLSKDEIKRYVASGEPMGKAGAYAIQGGAALFVEKIAGDYFNVVGLPLCELYDVLKKFGIKL
ncbi:MAG: septum formation inhibitor Maf [Elusimicrobia bacterium]|nr:septum formation inhibitor Maf [Elusimicrobiota bacterium]